MLTITEMLNVRAVLTQQLHHTNEGYVYAERVVSHHDDPAARIMRAAADEARALRFGALERYTEPAPEENADIDSDEGAGSTAPLWIPGSFP